MTRLSSRPPPAGTPSPAIDVAFAAGACATTEQLTTTVRGLDGKVLRIYKHPFDGGWNWERDYVYRDGQLLASVEPATGGGEDTFHFHFDHLGTPRQITDDSGAQAAFHTYYPFGEEATDPSQDELRLKFTGHERDENGSAGPWMLDYMHARYCSPGLGRFLTVDSIGKDRSRSPQGWNKFSYTLNNPLKLVDPDGKEEEESKNSLKSFLSEMQTTLEKYVGFNSMGVVDYRNGKFRQVMPSKGEAVALLGAAVAITIIYRSALAKDAEDALAKIESGADRANVRNPKPFTNDGRGGTEVLPATDSQGNQIQHSEHTVNPRQPGQALDGKRLIMGSDGSVYYTDVHFQTYRKVEDDAEQVRIE